MKHYVLSMGLILIAFCLLTCKENETATAPGQFEIQVDELIQENESGGRALTALPEGSSLLISIEDASGNVVLNFERVSIITFGGSSVSAPILLKPGNYKLRDFLIVDESDVVLYAIPKSGSAFAHLVKRPLPFSFSVWNDRVTNISTQVVRATESSPEKFGYVAFHIDEAAFPEFSLAAFALQNGQVALTQVKAFLIHDHDTIYSKLLPPKTNEIIFKGTPDDIYTLVLLKDGFAKYTHTFKLKDLKSELQGKPLEVFLSPAFTLTALIYPSESGEHQLIGLSAYGDNGKEIKTDWDDGSTSSSSLNRSNDYSFNLRHEYVASLLPSYKDISITGDIESIRYLRIIYEITVQSISLQQLKGLDSAVIYFQDNLKYLDFSGNKNLQFLAIGYAAQLESINISKNAKLKTLNLQDLNLTTEAIDNVINDLYANVVANNTINGMIVLNNVGEISEASRDKLDLLNVNYNFTIEAP